MLLLYWEPFEFGVLFSYMFLYCGRVVSSSALMVFRTGVSLLVFLFAFSEEAICLSTLSIACLLF